MLYSDAALDTKKVSSEIQRARQLFVEQLEFLDKEKYEKALKKGGKKTQIVSRDRLIEDLPPLATPEDDLVTTSSVESASRNASGNGKRQSKISTSSSSTVRSARTISELFEHYEEYAIDLNSPPLFSRLTHRTVTRAPRPKCQRKPSRKFMRVFLNQQSL